MVCYDSGGQPEFFDIMPALATNPTGYIMVLDLSKELDESIESEICINGETIKGKKIKCTELMKGAVAGIQSQSCKHRLLIVGTHLKEFIDQVQNPKSTEEYEGKLKSIDKKIFKDIIKGDASSLVRERQEGKNTQYLHPIDNLTKSVERDSIAQEIRTAVENMSVKEENICTDIPIKWLLFQLEIQLHIESAPKRNYISRTTCSECAKKCKINESEIDTVLDFFHDLGIILYYKKKAKDVVFSPQWLFD